MGYMKRRIADKWIYQEREASEPWAVHVFAEVRSGWKSPKAYITVFHDSMPRGCDTLLANVDVETPGQFATLVCKVLADYGIATTDDDADQLYRYWLQLVSYL